MHRRDVSFNVGDLVLVKLHLILCNQKLHKGLTRRYEGPYCITKKVNCMAYKLEMSPKLKVHLVFYVNTLKPYHVDSKDPSRC